MNPGSVGGISSVEEKLLGALQAKKLHIEPAALRLSPSHVQRRYEHPWAAIAALTERLRPWPEGLLWYILGHERGHILLTHRQSSYQEGEADFGGGRLSGVAGISLADMASDSLRSMHILGHLLDDLLGRGDALEGRWLSEGGGASPELREVGQRLQNLHSLGYGVDEVARGTPRDYFAQSWAIYWRDRRRLNVADPLLFKLLRSTLLSAAFWRKVEEVKG